MDKLLKIGITIYLKTSPHEIYRRIGNNKSRPLFQGLASLTKSISKRELIYERAHQIISTDNKPFSEIINEHVFEWGPRGVRPKGRGQVVPLAPP